MNSKTIPQEYNNTPNPKNQEKRLCYIYKHIRLDTNEVFYIGKGTNTDGKHKRAYSSDRTNPRWHNIVNKHGYKVDIVADNLTELEAFSTEIQLILNYGRLDLKTGTLVNMTEGGDGYSGAVCSEETRRKRSEASMGRKHTEKTKKIISDGKIGKPRSEETIEKMSKKVGKYKDGILMKEYPSTMSTELDGYNHGHVSSCCHGKRKSHGGFIWKFL